MLPARSAAATRDTKVTSILSEPSHTAWLAAEPPGFMRMMARRSEPRTIGPSGITMMSVMVSPTTRILGSAIGDSGGKRDGDLGRDAGVVLDQRDVGNEALTLGELEDAFEQIRRRRLAGDAGSMGV